MDEIEGIFCYKEKDYYITYYEYNDDYFYSDEVEIERIGEKLFRINKRKEKEYEDINEAIYETCMGSG